MKKEAVCPECGGEGGFPKQISERRYVTRDMALDACEPQLEGSLYSDEEWELDMCEKCQGTGKIEIEKDDEG